ncbi:MULTISPECIES: NUDIX hydrolase [Listeria]|uniref:NUDIX domain-containing protein n=1 Tax=Listeria TaxID=1637 RepID=UPI000B593697|nr:MULTISPECIES: NUDIX hydrolase [Listeria]
MTDNFVKQEEALESYDAKKFRTPDGYTSDILLFTVQESKLHVLLIERSRLNAEGKPNIEGGKWAFPGGFVDPNEDAHQAGIRELEEETGLTDIPLTAFGVYDKPGRDPRGWIITRAHYAFVPKEALLKRTALDDAANVALVSVDEAFKLPLAFDHLDILRDATHKINQEMLLSTKVSDFLPEFFTSEELYEALQGCTLKDAMPSFEEFNHYIELLPFLEQSEDGKYFFSSEANAHSIFF